MYMIILTFPVCYGKKNVLIIDRWVTGDRSENSSLWEVKLFCIGSKVPVDR